MLSVGLPALDWSMFDAGFGSVAHRWALSATGIRSLNRMILFACDLVHDMGCASGATLP
jgi:hypothetical protein